MVQKTGCPKKSRPPPVYSGAANKFQNALDSFYKVEKCARVDFCWGWNDKKRESENVMNKTRKVILT